MSAKAKGIGNSDMNGGMARVVGHIVQVALGIGVGEVDGRGCTVIGDRQNRCHRLNAPEPPNRCPVMDLVELTISL